MKKIEFVLAALLLVGCSKPENEPTPQSGNIKMRDDMTSSTATRRIRALPIPKTGGFRTYSRSRGTYISSRIIIPKTPMTPAWFIIWTLRQDLEK